MAQRISRAKRTVSAVRFNQAGDVATVLRVLYLVFNEGYPEIRNSAARPGRGGSAAGRGWARARRPSHRRQRRAACRPSFRRGGRARSRGGSPSPGTGSSQGLQQCETAAGPRAIPTAAA